MWKSQIQSSGMNLSMNWVPTATYTTKVIQVIQVLFCVQAFLYLQLQYTKACNHFSTQLCTHFEHVCDDTNLNGISLFHETTILCRWQAGGRGGRPQLPNCRGGSRKMEKGWHNRQESYPTSQHQNASESIPRAPSESDSELYCFNTSCILSDIFPLSFDTKMK